MSRPITPTVDVLLATYNGEYYLPSLLDSIFAQTHRAWHLIIRDDGSSDQTREIICRYRRSYPDRITILDESVTNLGPSQNFARLLTYSTSEYIMFCDQDDVWMSKKIELMIDRMYDLELRYGKSTPLLAHSDLIVTDANMTVISNSFWKYQHLIPEVGTTLSRLLMQNIITGNTVIMNRCAKERVLPIPNKAVMHDWWIALVVAAFGKIEHIATPTILYRQHSANVISAKKWGYWYRFSIKTLWEAALALPNLRDSIRRCEEQAKCFLKMYAVELDPHQREIVSAMAKLSEYNPIVRKWKIWHYRLFKIGFLRNAVLFAIV